MNVRIAWWYDNFSKMYLSILILQLSHNVNFVKVIKEPQY